MKDNREPTVGPAGVLFAEETLTESRKKEAARRIVEISGELHLTISDLEKLMDYIKKYAGATWIS